MTDATSTTRQVRPVEDFHLPTGDHVRVVAQPGRLASGTEHPAWCDLTGCWLDTDGWRYHKATRATSDLLTLELVQAVSVDEQDPVQVQVQVRDESPLTVEQARQVAAELVSALAEFPDEAGR